MSVLSCLVNLIFPTHVLNKQFAGCVVCSRIMPQENEAVSVELNFSSQEIKQHLLNLVPSKCLLVQSIDKHGHRLHLEW